MLAAGVHIQGHTFLRENFGSELTPANLYSVDPLCMVAERGFWEPAGPDWRQDDLYAVGYALCRSYFAHFPPRHVPGQKCYYLIINEPIIVNRFGTVSFWNGALDYAVSIGVKLGILNSPYFWPGLPSDDLGPDGIHRAQDGADCLFFKEPLVHTLLRRVIAGGHIVAQHWYIYPDPGGPWDGGPMSRWEAALTYMPVDVQAVPVAATECGTGVGGTIDVIPGFTAADRYYHKGKGNYQFLAAWSGGRWPSDTRSDLGPSRAKIAAYQKTARF